LLEVRNTLRAIFLSLPENLTQDIVAFILGLNATIIDDNPDIRKLVQELIYFRMLLIVMAAMLCMACTFVFFVQMTAPVSFWLTTLPLLKWVELTVTLCTSLFAVGVLILAIFDNAKVCQSIDEQLTQIKNNDNTMLTTTLTCDFASIEHFEGQSLQLSTSRSESFGSLRSRFFTDISHARNMTLAMDVKNEYQALLEDELRPGQIV
jgi:hypothetical protein